LPRPIRTPTPLPWFSCTRVSAARDVELVKLADCRHSPHKDQPEAVIAAVAGFVADLLAQ